MAERFIEIKTGGTVGRKRTSLFRPRINSLFQFLLVSESEIKKLVNEMDGVGSFCTVNFPARRMTRGAASREPQFIGSGAVEVVQ